MLPGEEFWRVQWKSSEMKEERGIESEIKLQSHVRITCPSQTPSAPTLGEKKYATESDQCSGPGTSTGEATLIGSGCP